MNRYDWKRFWCQRTGGFSLQDEGYLFDPDGEYGAIYNPDVKTFAEIDNYPVLALLGEPGIGKSFALEQMIESTREKVSLDNGHVLALNLNSYASESRLERKIFESLEFKAWHQGDGPLYIFLDSLDECLLSIPTISRLLATEFNEYPCDNLFFRITCRTLVWPDGLESSLCDHWGEENVAVFELTPLRRIDVTNAVTANNLDPVQFTQEIKDRDVVPFAIKPLTLKMLIDIFKQNDNLPNTKKDIFHKGCLLLAEESSNSRSDAQQLGKLNPLQRLIIAARIAALTIYGGKTSIWLGTDYEAEIETDLTLTSMAGAEICSGTMLEVTPTSLRETLDTGLFTARGQQRIGWAHQSYAEYLAAWYLSHRNVGLKQIITLFCHPESFGKKLIPQLTETAAWLGSIDNDFFSHLMTIDPETLLMSDFGAVANKDKENLIEQLLLRYESGEAVDSDWDLKGHYCKLVHPGLAEQLQPYIVSSTFGRIVRRVAIEIADACNLESLQNELLTIALEVDEEEHIRNSATRAICNFNNKEICQQLKPLAFGEAGDDPDDQLKGKALSVLWPKSITAEELFFCLTPPKNKNLIGSYHMFMSEGIAQGFSAANVTTALAWVEGLSGTLCEDFPHRKLIQGILAKSLDLLSQPGVPNAFVRCLLALTKKYKYEPLRKVLGPAEDQKRYQIIEEIFSLLESGLVSPGGYEYSSAQLLSTKDVPWLIERRRREQSVIIREKIADIIEYLYVYEQADLILTACVQDAVLAEKFKNIRDAVALESPEADEMRSRAKATESEREKIHPTPLMRVYANLEQTEAGNADAWCDLLFNMGLDEYGYGTWPNKDIRNEECWNNLGEEGKQRIIVAAKRYILKGTPNLEPLFTTSYKISTVASDFALRLLNNEDPAFAIQLDVSILEKWAAVIFYFAQDGEELSTSLLQKLHQSSPNAIAKVVTKIIDTDKQGHFLSLHQAKSVWSEQLSDIALAKVRGCDLSSRMRDQILEILLQQGIVEAQNIVEEQLKKPFPEDESERLVVVQAVMQLLQYAPDAGWQTVWPAINNDQDFADLFIANLSRHEVIIPRLTDEQATDLYIWLLRNEPPSEKTNDPFSFSDSLLRHLRARGSKDACLGLEKISAAFPEKSWLIYSLLDAQANYRRSSWRPPTTKEILSLTENNNTRLVRSGEELLDVIIASLRRLEEKLHGVTPSSIFLWDTDRTRPRNENDFSDFIEIHLKEDLSNRGIIANREVEFRRLSKTGVGEKTDIVVDAICNDGNTYNVISVVIESKGCWNTGIKSAMKDQLKNMYLIDSQYRFGLYLVGWFLCDEWEDSHDQKKSTKRLNMDIDNAQIFFNEQAIELSTGGHIIKAVVMDTALPRKK